MEPSQRYAWQGPYEAAMLSTEPAQLPALIAAAQAAIDERVAEIAYTNNGALDERIALEAARNDLRILVNKTRSEP
jgi:hypothetical protein